VQDTSLTRPGAVAFLGNRLSIDDDLVALRASVDGEFRLAGSRVGGSVLLDGAALRNEGGYALHAPDMSVGARFLARDGFSAHGEVRLVGLRVDGDLNFRNALLSNPGGSALLAYGIQTGGSLGLSDGFRAQGAVRLSRSKIGGGIFLEQARLDNPAGDAIRCRNTQAQTLHLGAGLEASGIADFRNSQFANIRDQDADWPQRLRLAGLGYGELVPPLSAALRVHWLRHDVDGYVPRNYETLAAMYRNAGTTPAPARSCWPGSASIGPTFPGTGGPGRGCRRSPSDTGTGRCGRPSGCWRSSRPAHWPSACTTRRRWPGFRIPPSTRSSTRWTWCSPWSTSASGAPTTRRERSAGSPTSHRRRLDLRHHHRQRDSPRAPSTVVGAG
jgi:hypothetical protein